MGNMETVRKAAEFVRFAARYYRKLRAWNWPRRLALLRAIEAATLNATNPGAAPGE